MSSPWILSTTCEVFILSPIFCKYYFVSFWSRCLVIFYADKTQNRPSRGTRLFWPLKHFCQVSSRIIWRGTLGTLPACDSSLVLTVLFFLLVMFCLLGVRGICAHFPPRGSPLADTLTPGRRSCKPHSGTINKAKNLRDIFFVGRFFYFFRTVFNSATGALAVRLSNH